MVNSFTGLFTYRDKNEIVPDLAESYEVSKDGKAYTFHLLPDLKWSGGSKLAGLRKESQLPPRG